MQRNVCQNKKVLKFSGKKKEKKFSEKIRKNTLTLMYKKNKQEHQMNKVLSFCLVFQLFFEDLTIIL